MPITQLEWDAIGLQITRERQADGFASLSKDEAPESSSNWWICSDGEDLILGGTLDECLEVSGVRQNQLAQSKKLCLVHGCLWFFPGNRDTVTIEADPIKASRKTERNGGNFLTLQHSPLHANQYKSEVGSPVTIEKAEALDTGTIVIEVQRLWEVPTNQLNATIRMDLAGRAQLIAALIEGTDSIDVSDDSGGVYSLYLRSIEGYLLD